MNDDYFNYNEPESFICGSPRLKRKEIKKDLGDLEWIHTCLINY